MAPKVPATPRCCTTGPKTAAAASDVPDCLTESAGNDRPKRTTRTEHHMSISKLFAAFNRSSARCSMRAAVTRPHLQLVCLLRLLQPSSFLRDFATSFGACGIPVSVVTLAISDGQAVRNS